MKHWILALALLIPNSAWAYDGSCDGQYVRQVFRSCDYWNNCHIRHDWRCQRRPVYRHRHVDVTPDRGRDRSACLGTPVDILSTEHTQEDHAKDAARKLWMAKVQWAQGSVYMDLDEATDTRWRCGPSNAHDTFTSKLSEAAQKLVGQDGQNVRCALSARPCRAESEGVSRKDRR